jgi:predicted ribosomally synthesized peptide with SipW-like signal peptide
VKTRRAIILASLAVLVAVAVSFAYFSDRAVKARIGPVHRFELSESPPYLTEGLALEKARETLRLDGLDNAHWMPHPDGRTKAPDGRTDQFMGRNSINSNNGVFLFTGGTNEPARFVSVELHGNVVVCRGSVGK